MILIKFYYCRFKSAIKSFLKVSDYDWIKDIRSSDHKPVFAVFDLVIPNNNTNILDKNKSVKSTKTSACQIV